MIFRLEMVRVNSGEIRSGEIGSGEIGSRSKSGQIELNKVIANLRFFSYFGLLRLLLCNFSLFLPIFNPKKKRKATM